MSHRSALVAAALTAVATLGASSCSSDPGSDIATDPAPVTPPDYTSERVAPLPKDVKGSGSDETPEPEDALVEIELDSGAVAALWIDLDDIAKVFVQYSDPKDDAAWTAPALVYEAGDGCLIMNADTAGATLAVGLGCYATDAFIQQAPDEGVALVSTDLRTWDVMPVEVDSYPEPEVSEDGKAVVFNSQVYEGQVDARWEQGKGF